MIKKRLISLLLVLVLFSVSGGVLAASNIDDCKWFGVIQVRNSDTAVTNVATTANISTTVLQAGNYLNASANNCAIRTSSGADVAFMPGYTPDGNPWCIWVPSIGDDGIQSDILYTADTYNGDIAYFPGTAGMTTPDDNADFELSDNFTIEQYGWVNTDNGTGKNLVRKTDAFYTFVSPTVSGNITSGISIDFPTTIEQTDQDTSVNLRAGSTLRAGERIDDFPHSTITQVSFYLKKTGAPIGDITVTARAVAGDAIIGTFGTKAAADLGAGFAWYDFTDDVVIPSQQDIRILVEFGGGGAGDTVDVGRDTGDPTAYGIWTHYVAAYTDDATDDATFKSYQTMLEFEASVTATGVESGEHEVKSTIDYNPTFDGDDFIDFGDSDDFSFTDAVDGSGVSGNDMPFSICVWFNSSNSTGNHYLISKHNSSVGMQGEWYCRFDSGKPLFRIVTGPSAGNFLGRKANVAPSLNTWYMLTLTYDGSEVEGGLKMYLSRNHGWGTVRIDDTSTSAGSYTGMPNTATPLEAGRQNVGADYWYGQIGSIEIYKNRELTLSEIEDIAQENLTDTTGLVLDIPMNEGQGTEVTDGNTFRIEDTEAHQGVASDGTYLYTSNSTALMKWSLDGTSLITSNTDANNDGTDCIQINNIYIKDGRIYAGAFAYGYVSYIKVFEASDLSYIEEHAVGTGADYATEGTAFHDNYWWVIYNEPIIRKYDSSWNYVAEYPLSYADGAYQGIFWDNDELYVNNHDTSGGSSNPPFIDHYHWTGTGFTAIERLLRPTPECSQGVTRDPVDSSILWWAERNIIDDCPTSPHNVIKSSFPWYPSGNVIGGTWETGMFKLYVDDTLEDWDTGANVPDNDNNWTFAENDSFMWLKTQDITIGGVLSQDIEWEYATVFQDATAYNNDCTPSFRGASSDADVTAELVSFSPVSEAKAPAYTLETSVPFIDADALTSNMTSAFTTAPPAGTGTFPLAAVITALANATSTPAQLPLLTILTFIILAASLSVSAIIRQYGSGSLFIKTGVIIAIMGIFVAFKNFGIDFWMIVVFLTMAIAIMFASKQSHL